MVSIGKAGTHTVNDTGRSLILRWEEFLNGELPEQAISRKHGKCVHMKVVYLGCERSKEAGMEVGTAG